MINNDPALTSSSFRAFWLYNDEEEEDEGAGWQAPV
jgi:hypothetical protein